MKAKHRYQIVDEAGEVDLLSLINIISRHIVVGEEVDAEGSLEKWKHALITVKIEWYFRWKLNEFQQHFFVLNQKHELPDFETDCL